MFAKSLGACLRSLGKMAQELEVGAEHELNRNLLQRPALAVVGFEFLADSLSESATRVKHSATKKKLLVFWVGGKMCQEPGTFRESVWYQERYGVKVSLQGYDG